MTWQGFLQGHGRDSIIHGIVQAFKQGYGDGSMAPGVLGIGTTAYISAHNQVNHSVATALGGINIVVAFQILAHARAYRIYQRDFSQVQGGRWVLNLAKPLLSFRVGVTLNIHWAEPEDPSDPTHMEVILVAGILQRKFSGV